MFGTKVHHVGAQGLFQVLGKDATGCRVSEVVNGALKAQHRVKAINSAGGRASFFPA